MNRIRSFLCAFIPVLFIIPLFSCELEILPEEGNYWARILTGPDSEIINDLSVTDEGQIIAAGTAINWKYPESSLAFMTSLDVDGTILWQKIYNASRWNRAEAIVATPDGGCVMGAISPLTSGAAWITRSDSSGSLLWSREYTFPMNNYFIRATQIVRTGDDEYLVMYMGKNNSAILRIDGDGSLLWSKMYAIKNTVFSDNVQLIALSDGSFALLSYIGRYGEREIALNSESDELIQENVLLVKFDAEGTILWSREFGKDGVYVNGCMIREGSDGSLIVAGRAASTVAEYFVLSCAGEDICFIPYPVLEKQIRWDTMVFSVNSAGTLIWGKTYRDTDWLLSSETFRQDDQGRPQAPNVRFTIAADGDIIVAGRHNDIDKYGRGFWVLSTDSMGKIKNRIRYTTDENISINGLTISPDESLVIFGGYASECLIMRTDENALMSGSGLVYEKYPVVSYIYKPEASDAAVTIQATSECTVADLPVTVSDAAFSISGI